MEAKKIARVWVLLGSLVWMPLVPLVPVWAAQVEEAEAVAAPAAPIARSAVLPGTENVAPQLMPSEGGARGLDAYRWLDAAKQEGMLVHRAAHQGPGKGVALLVSADVGAHSGGSLVGQLRQVLPAEDWHSYLVGLPLRSAQPSEQQDAILVQRVTQAMAVVEGAHPDSPVVLFAEGSASARLAAMVAPDGQLQASGLVLLNQRPPKTMDGPLSKLQTPTLLLQVLPNRYPKGYPLAEAVELRQLPRVSPRQPKSLVLRQVQGWLRQFEPPGEPLG